MKKRFVGNIVISLLVMIFVESVLSCIYLYDANKQNVLIEIEKKEEEVFLELKPVVLFEGEDYRIDDFVLSCFINKEDICHLAYGDSSMENIKKVGKYNITISVQYRNYDYQETTQLIIKKKKEKKKKAVEEKQEEIVSFIVPENCDEEKILLWKQALVMKEQEKEKINEILALVNLYRIEYKETLNVLVLDESLTSLAFIRAIEMAKKDYLSHTRPNGKMFYTVFDDYNMQKNEFIAENIASGYMQTSTVSLGWKNSLPHYQNMVHEKFLKIGIGVTCAYKSCYWVQLFSS